MLSIGEHRTGRQILLQRLEAVAHLWLRRRRTRRALAALNDYELRDIGLTPEDARGRQACHSGVLGIVHKGQEVAHSAVRRLSAPGPSATLAGPTYHRAYQLSPNLI